MKNHYKIYSLSNPIAAACIRAKALWTVPIVLILQLLLVGTSFGQVNMTTTATTSYTENFNGVTGTGTALPANWKLHRATTASYTSGATVVTQTAGSGSPTTGALYKWGTSAALTENAYGAMTSGGFASPNHLMVAYTNNTGSAISSVAISANVERYRRNTAAASVQAQYSTNGTSWTNFSAGTPLVTLATGSSVYGFPQSTSPLSSSLTISIASGSTIYFNFNIVTTGSNSQGVGIDDFTFTPTFTLVAPTITSLLTGSTTYGTAGSYTLTASGSPTSLTATAVGGGTLPTGFTYSSPTLTVASTTAAGTYNIELKANNLQGTDTKTLVYTVSKKALTVTASAQSKVYGTTLTTIGSGQTLFTSSGLVGAQTIGSVTLAASGGTAANAAATTYTLTPSLATGGTFDINNYTVTYNTGTLTVSKAPLTITASAQSKVYGATLTTVGASQTLFSSSGLQNSETIGTVTLAINNSGASAGAAVSGTYTITPSAATGGTFNINNYTVTYNTAALTITRAPLTVTGSSHTRNYGDNNPALTVGYSGFVNSETVAALTTAPTATTSATSTSVPSTYAVVPAGGVAANYSFNYVNGVLTVDQRPLTITADNQAKPFGATLTTIGAGQTLFSSTGLASGQSITSVTLTASGGTAAPDVAGTYTITPSAALGITTSNYAITYVDGTLTVNNKTAQTITFGSLSPVVYGSSTFNLTATATSGLTVTFVSSDPSVATISGTTVTIVGAGNTTITASQAGDATFNFAPDVDQALVVSAKPATLTGISGTNKIYDATTIGSITGTATIVGVLAGDVANVAVGGSPVATFASATVANGISVGVTGYALTGTRAYNYSLTQPTLSANITTKAISITGLTGTTRAYNRSAAGAFTGTAALSGVETADLGNVTLSGTGSASFADANVGTSKTLAVTGYSLTGSAAGNYSLNALNLTANITTAPLGVTGLAATSRVYDATTLAAITGTASLSGIIAGDEGTVGITGTPVGGFADANVGNPKTVTITGLSLTGANASNYALNAVTTTAAITAATQVLTFTLSPSTVTTADGPLTISASSTALGATISFTSGTPSVATISGTTVTLTTTGGSTIITATSVAANYNNATATQTLTVVAANLTSGNIAVWPSTSNPSGAMTMTTPGATINAASSAVTRVGLGVGGGSARYNCNGWNNAANYVRILVTAADCYRLNLNGGSISIPMGSSGTGPNNYRLFSSVDNYTTAIATLNTSCSSTTANNVTLPSTGYNGLASIEFRIVGGTQQCSTPASAVSGTGTGGPLSITLNGSTVGATILPSGTTAALTTTTGTASSTTSAFVAGSNIATSTPNITVTAPAGYEVSLTEVGGFASSVSVTGSGSVANRQIFARLLSTNVPGVYSGNISLTACQAVTKTIPITGTVYPAKPAITQGATATVCQNGSLNLSVPNLAGYTYAWSNGSTGASIAYPTSSAGTNNITVTSTHTASGLSSVVSEGIEVAVYALPSTPLLSAANNAELCAGSVVSITNAAACPTCDYAWSDASTGTTRTLLVGSNNLSVASTNPNSCVANSAAITVTGLMSGTWLASSSEWSNANNWCGGVPTATTDLVIRPTSTTVPTVITPTSVCRSLTIGTGKTVNINSGGKLTLFGNLSGAGQLVGASGSELELNGSSAQYLGIAAVGSLTVNNASGVNLTQEVTVADGLVLANGNLDATAAPLTFLPTASNPVETGSNRIIGRVRGRGRSVGTGALHFLGVDLAAGADDLDTVLVERRDEAATNGTSSGIGATWSIRAHRQPVSGRQVTLRWLAALNNGSRMSAIQVWRKPEGGAAWVKVGNLQNIASTTNGFHSITVVTDGFSDWTSSDEDNVLPVSFTSFRGKAQDGGNQLSWTTAQETNNAGFTVERSQDGRTFEPVAFVKGAGTTANAQQYTYFDQFGRTAYYRLTQRDFDGKTALSDIIYVNRAAKTNDLTLYPNPATKFVRLSGQDIQAQVEVLGTDGRTLISTSVQAGETIDLSKLPAGIYQYRITTDGGSKTNKLVIY
jgi:hypothetical protein